ncbi:MAG: rhomboid family intramembrane serine protease [Bacteroidetes bacterium]|nr:rhomboid family intramembrane serine protease [Bacteroidota bacterium]
MSYEQYRPNKFSYLPLVVKNLLIINGLFFLATLAMANQGIDLEDKLGLHFPLSEKFQPYQLITYMFMHGGFMHLFFNMFALWMFGNTLENLWGPKRFLIYYLITGVGAALCHYTVVYFQITPTLNMIDAYIANPSLEAFKVFLESEDLKFTSMEMLKHYNDTIPTYFNDAIASNDYAQALRISVDYMNIFKDDYLNAPVVVGASGSVFGILLAFGMLFPNTLLYLYFAIPIKAKWFVMAYGAMELFSGIRNNPGDNVAHFAHLGGMLFGFILIKYWQKKSNRIY